MRPARRALPALVGLLALAGCSRNVDRDQASLCRMAASGLAGQVRLRITAQSPLAARGDLSSGVRLTILPEDPDLRLTWLECRFVGGGSQPDLVSVATPAGPLDETHLVLLRRFWLGSDEARDNDPGLGDDQDAALPALPVAVAYLLQQILDALPNAAIYGLLGAAYSIVYGLYGRINLAFGALAAVGGLAAVIGSAALPEAPAGGVLALAAALALWASGLHGIVMERLVLWRLRAVSGQHGLVATVGIALFLQEYLRLATGAQPHWVRSLLADPFRLARAGGFIVTVTPMAAILTGTAAGAAAALLLTFRFSRFGRNWRAAADDPGAASLFGVDPRRLSLETYGLAAALVGLAGAGVTLHYGGLGVEYTTGLGLKALIAAIVGGIGSVPGAFLGGIGIALVEALWSSYFPIADRDLVVFLLLVATLTLRPGGLFGDRDLSPRRV